MSVVTDYPLAPVPQACHSLSRTTVGSAASMSYVERQRAAPRVAALAGAAQLEQLLLLVQTRPGQLPFAACQIAAAVVETLGEADLNPPLTVTCLRRDTLTQAWRLERTTLVSLRALAHYLRAEAWRGLSGDDHG